MTRSVTLIAAVGLLVALVAFDDKPAIAGSADPHGVVHGGLYSSASLSSTGADLTAMGTATGKKVSLGGTFGSPGNDPGPANPAQWSNTRERLDQIWRGQATPFYNLSMSATAQQIANGSRDAEINRWIDHMKMYLDLGGGRNLILAPLQEMNGDWVTYGCSPAHFRTAYRRIHDLVRARGIDETKVRFAFAPNGWTTPGCGTIHDYYPGDQYTDLIGISSYRWSDGGTVQQVMGNYIDNLAATYPTKPLIIAQTAAWPTTTRDQWIRDMFSWAAGHPNVVAVIYFNYDKETDWRVWIPPSTVRAGWRDGMTASSTVYQWPLTGWFQPGPLTLAGVKLCPGGGNCDTVAVQDPNGRFHLYTHATSGLVANSFFYGIPGDVPISGDWDCDGVETLGLYRRSTGYVYLRNSNSQGVAHLTYFFGIPGDIPIAGDFNGNGCDTVSIYRPSEAKFYITNQLGSADQGFVAEYSFFFGVIGDKPFVGDFNGNGVDTVGLHRESTGLVYFRNTNSTGSADFQFLFGIPGDQLIAGDWNGNGIDTVGVYRRSNGMLYLRNSHTTGPANSQVYLGQRSGLVSINP